MSAVSQQQRITTNAKSNFIEDNQGELCNVSTLNMVRACQIKDQFLEQRKLVKMKLEQKYENMKQD